MCRLGICAPGSQLAYAYELTAKFAMFIYFKQFIIL